MTFGHKKFNFRIPSKEVKTMMELSSLLFKPIIEREHSKIVGRIKNAYFSQGCNCIAYFVISSCKNDCDALLPIDEVLCFCDALVIQNDANVRCVSDVDFTAFSSGVIGMDVYTQSGILKGKIAKVDFAKSGKVSKLYTETEQFSPQNVACVGDVILLKAAKQSKAKKQTIPRPEHETTVFVLKTDSTQKESVRISENKNMKAAVAIPVEDASTVNESQTEAQFTPVHVTTAPMAKRPTDDSPLFSSNALKLLDAPETDDDSHTPARIISDYSFLLGRVLSGDLTSYTGTIIAKAGTIIDDSLVEKSRLCGKLVDLVLLAKNV